MLYSDNSRHNTAEVVGDLSKCIIKEVEKPAVDRTGGVPINKIPFHAPQNMQGVMTDRSMYFVLSLPFLLFTFLLSASHTVIRAMQVLS